MTSPTPPPELVEQWRAEFNEYCRARAGTVFTGTVSDISAPFYWTLHLAGRTAEWSESQRLREAYTRLHEWIADKFSDGCEYGEPTTTACLASRTHYQCRSCQAQVLLAETAIATEENGR